MQPHRALIGAALAGTLVLVAARPTDEPAVTVASADVIRPTRAIIVATTTTHPPSTTTTAEPTTTTTQPPPTTTTTAHPVVVSHVPTTSAPRPVGDCGGWADLIAAYFPGEEAKACSVMMCESGGNLTAENPRSSASGLWQFLASTWESVTGTPAPASAYDAETQTAAAARLRRQSGWGQWSCS